MDRAINCGHKALRTVHSTYHYLHTPFKAFTLFQSISIPMFLLFFHFQIDPISNTKSKHPAHSKPHHTTTEPKYCSNRDNQRHHDLLLSVHHVFRIISSFKPWSFPINLRCK